MTIRSGGRPRDSRAAEARPYDPDAYATETIPEFSQPVPGGRRGRGGRGGSVVGLLKFLVFALVLAALVLAIALTALRPAVADAVMSIADDNPATLQLPFVKDIVRREARHGPDDPRLAGHDAGRVPRRAGRHGQVDRHQARGGGPDRRQPGIRVHRDRAEPDRIAPAGDVHPAQEHDPRPARASAARAGARTQVRRHRPAHRPPARAGHGQARDAPAPDGRVRVLRHRDLAAGRAGQRLPVAQEDPGRRAQGRLARRLPLAGDLSGAAGHDARGARPADARQVRGERRAGSDERPGCARHDLLPGADPGLDRRARGDARRGEAAHRRGLRQPARPEEVAARPAPVGPDDLLPPRFARAGQGAGDRLARVRVLGPDQGRTDLGRPAGGAGRLQHVHQQGAAARPDLPRPRPTSIDAALDPDTSDGYLYFIAKGDGTGTSAFAKTAKEHAANVKKYLKP